MARQIPGMPPDGPRQGTPEPAEEPLTMRERDIERAREGERIGPVAITRYVKPDGRALIVYTSDVPSPA